jgi:hypothetical protein
MPNDKAQSSNQIKNPNAKIYDLEERTAKLGEDIIDFGRSLKRDEITTPLITQLVKSGTSVMSQKYYE